MKIKYLKTYQSIEFGKDRTQLNSFLATEYHSDTYSKMPKVNFEEHAHGILISNEDDCVLVGWPNIAFLRYDRTAAPAKLAKAK